MTQRASLPGSACENASNKDPDQHPIATPDHSRIVSVAAIIAVAVNTDGRREIVGLGIVPSEAEPFWSTFLKGLVKRELGGVELVIRRHEGLRNAITRVLDAT